MTDNIKIKNGFGFKYSDETKKLFAVIVPSDDKTQLTSTFVKQRIKDENFEFFINEYLLSEFLRIYHREKEKTLELEIGEMRDAVCEINLQKDNMKATLWLTPTFGGKKITLEDIQNELKAQKIVFGIVPINELEELVKQEKVENFVIAQGVAAISGINAQFKSVIAEIEKKPFVNDDDSVDYRELGDIVIVQKGDLLMERIPATLGTEGINVLGKKLKAKKGKDEPFVFDKNSVYVNPENKDQLLSAITGTPDIFENGAAVLPVLVVDDVNFESGNIRFDGSIVVKGSIMEGMSVYATKDISVAGDVVNSTIECHGNLLIKGGVTGNSQFKVGGNVKIKRGIQGNKEFTPILEPKIIAEGFVTVGFSENFTVESNASIVIEKYALNSYLMAKDKIDVGLKSRSKKPSLMGGQTWATKSVRTSVLGADTGITTKVCVGTNPKIELAILKIKQTLEIIEQEITDIRQSILRLESHGHDKENQAIINNQNFVLTEWLSQNAHYQKELKRLTSQIVVIDDAKVIVDKNVYAGAVVQIKKSVWLAKAHYDKTTFSLSKNKISLNE